MSFEESTESILSSEEELTEIYSKKDSYCNITYTKPEMYSNKYVNDFIKKYPFVEYHKSLNIIKQNYIQQKQTIQYIYHCTLCKHSIIGKELLEHCIEHQKNL